MTEQQDARDFLDRAERAAGAGDFESADELLRDAARIQEEELGPRHPDLANTLNNLAIVAERRGQPGEAETLYRRAAAIAAAALPPEHPMVVASRQNLEDFCRARGLPIDVPAVVTPVAAAEPEETPAAPKEPAAAEKTAIASVTAEPASRPPDVPLRHPDPVRPAVEKPLTLDPDPDPGRASRSFPWLAAGALVLVAVVLLVWRPWSSRDTSTPAATPPPAAAQPSEAVAPRTAAPPTAPPAAIEQPRLPAAAPPRDDRKVTPQKPAGASGVTLSTAQVCRNFSTSGSSWRCDPVSESTEPGQMTLYTRVRSPRQTEIVHRWFHNGALRQSVTLTIQASATEGYRTYSRQTVGKGDWRLEVRSANGDLLHEQRFAVR